MNRPDRSEYDSYYEGYISLVENADIQATLAGQPAQLRKVFGELAEEKGTFTYEVGKWSIKELIGHVIDGERMFAYRAFRISRGDKTPIEGFEQDGYIENARSNERTFADLLDEFELLRVANVLMFNHMNDADRLRSGTANNVEITVRSIAFIMAGHVAHHVNILNERYLV
ncbi:MAG: DinB family protein [Acidobacteriota bacterium]